MRVGEVTDLGLARGNIPPARELGQGRLEASHNPGPPGRQRSLWPKEEDLRAQF